MKKDATDYLNNLKKINFSEINEQYKEDVLLFNDILTYEDNNKLTSNNKPLKDLLRVIKIINPLECAYEETNILTPRVYAEKHNPIPTHISIQCLMFSYVKDTDINKLKEIINNSNYNKTTYDTMWISKNKNINNLNDNDILYLMNRRVGGWDGSIDRPVIELLCAGGHLPTIWNNNSFKTMSYEELLKKEIEEELKIKISDNQLIKLGGFHNKVSNELVILYSIFVTDKLFDIIELSKGNINENIDGIYIGEFNDVMNLYKENPQIFAGGEKAYESNFPNNKALMKRIDEIL